MANPISKTIKNSIRHWYLFLLTGLIFIAIGIWTILTPLGSYLTLSMIFSAGFLVAGILEIIFAISNRKELDSWGWTVLYGIINLLTGLLLIANPEISIVTLPFYVGFTVLFRSLMAIGTSYDLDNYGVPGTGSLLGIGILGIIFSFILLGNPGFAGLSLVIWTALALLTAGANSIYFAFKLKKLHS